MRYYSTRNKGETCGFGEAALTGLAPDGGLFVPQEIPSLRPSAAASLGTMAFADIAFETVRPFVHADIPDTALADIVHGAFTFDAPLKSVGPLFVLELFHGPTAAFKDFGARFMARAFAYFRRGETRPLKILTATSGDTGGAVADGFAGVDGISVTVLYPKGRVSPLQERQIAGIGGNIGAIAVDGSFDDCQRLVKAAFADPDLRARLALSSANSINIARLVPQSVYYVSAAGALKALRPDAPSVFCVPSGNFGNLTAGMYARAMGAPIGGFVAAVNSNRTFPDYLSSGSYEPRQSVPTLSNAMDVGAPSNFERLVSHWTLAELRRVISSVSVDDEGTRDAIASVYSRHGYVLDPHGAVGFAAVSRLEADGTLPASAAKAVLATAHPAKFAATVEPITGPVEPPPCLKEAMTRTVRAVGIAPELEALKAVL